MTQDDKHFYQQLQGGVSTSTGQPS